MSDFHQFEIGSGYLRHYPAASVFKENTLGPSLLFLFFRKTAKRPVKNGLSIGQAEDGRRTPPGSFWQTIGVPGPGTGIQVRTKFGFSDISVLIGDARLDLRQLDVFAVLQS